MNVSLLLSILAGVILAVGFLGTFVPVLPGAPMAWGGLLAAFFSDYCEVSLTVLIVSGVFAVIVSILDNILPISMTKKFGGSKAAVTGSTVGLIIGFFIGPAGIMLGPLIGAFLGEFIHNKGKKIEGDGKAALGAFVGFLLGTGIKMICVLVFICYYIATFS